MARISGIIIEDLHKKRINMHVYFRFYVDSSRHLTSKRSFLIKQRHFHSYSCVMDVCQLHSFTIKTMLCHQKITQKLFMNSKYYYVYIITNNSHNFQKMYNTYELLYYKEEESNNNK